MTKQDLLKYAGKKTFGKNSELLTNGIIVGFDQNDDDECLVARFENGDVSGAGWSISALEITFFTEKEEEIYKSGKGCYLFARIDNVIMDEQKELDLTEILKGCEGVKLFSEVFGVGEVYSINDFVCVKSEKGYLHYFNYNGRLKQYPDGNCLLWPSETNRDWSTFKKPIKDDDWVACCDRTDGAVILRYKEVVMKWKYVIPFERYNPTLQEEDLKKLSIV